MKSSRLLVVVATMAILSASLVASSLVGGAASPAQSNAQCIELPQADPELTGVRSRLTSLRRAGLAVAQESLVVGDDELGVHSTVTLSEPTPLRRAIMLVEGGGLEPSTAIVGFAGQSSYYTFELPLQTKDEFGNEVPYNYDDVVQWFAKIASRFQAGVENLANTSAPNVPSVEAVKADAQELQAAIADNEGLPMSIGFRAAGTLGMARRLSSMASIDAVAATELGCPTLPPVISHVAIDAFASVPVGEDSKNIEPFFAPPMRRNG